jgi:hypothetical protein
MSITMKDDDTENHNQAELCAAIEEMTRGMSSTREIIKSLRQQ